MYTIILYLPAYSKTDNFQIRTSEEILSLTRQMQELWLFGQLKTLEKGELQERIDQDAKEVAALLGQLAGGVDEVKVEA